MNEDVQGGDVHDDALKVYLESSFISYLTGRDTADVKIAESQAYTRKWWRDERGKCLVFTSRFVVDESNDGNVEQIAARRRVLADMPIVSFDEKKVSDLAAKLLDGHAIPEKEVTDAFHIATAAVLGADVLLTWNCRHMANPHTLPKTRKIVTESGYVCPAVMTPKTFLENIALEDEHE